ncbi:MAG: VCBS repeat-containing protein [Planctomycetota bacterium]
MITRLPLVGATALVAAATLPAQSSFAEQYAVRHPSINFNLGEAVCVPGDMGGDGGADFVVGTAFGNAIRIYSGVDGRLLDEVTGSSTEHIGHAIAAVGDTDADGRPDFAYSIKRRFGAVVIVSGRTLQPRRIIDPPVGGRNFGRTVAGAGDIDGDGHDDLMVAFDRLGSSTPVIETYSGKDGTFIARGLFDFRSFGGVGDVDGDGASDQAYVTASQIDVFSGRTRAPIVTIRLAAGFGAGVAAADLDGDGVRDLVVGAPGGPSSPGEVLVFKSFTSNLMMRVAGVQAGVEFGHDVAVADFDGDGRDDLIASAPATGLTGHPGYAEAIAFDGTPTGRVLATVAGSLGGERFGFALDVGDVNADGRPDLVVGSPKASEVVRNAGRVTALVNTSAIDPGRVLGFGASCAGSLGRRSRMAVAGLPVVGGTFDLTVRAAPIGEPAVALFGAGRSSTPLDPLGMPGCTLLTAPLATLIAQTDIFGQARRALPVPPRPVLVGGSIAAQWFVRDVAANPFGWISSGAVEIRIGGG